MAVSDVSEIEVQKTKQYIDKDMVKYQNMVRERWFIIPGRSSGRYYWDMFVMILALYNSFMAPFEFSFDYVMASSKTQPFRSIDITIDLIYVVDIIVGFLTSYIDSFTGDEINAPKQIAKHYIGGEFALDFLSTFYFFEAMTLPGLIHANLDIPALMGPVIWQQFVLVF